MHNKVRLDLNIYLFIYLFIFVYNLSQRYLWQDMLQLKLSLPLIYSSKDIWIATII